MLRITVRDEEPAWQMKLEGKLCAAWAAEAEAVWDASPVNRRREVDLRNVTGTDEAGKALLAAMEQSGAKLIVHEVKIQGHRKHLALTAALLILGGSLHAETMRLTLKDAVNIALKQNPQVAIANLNVAESQQQSKVARSALLPQASFTASDKVTRGNIEALFGTKIKGLPQHNGPFWAIQAGPGFDAPLFDLTAWNRWKASREEIGASSAQKTSARELNVQLVVSQYLGSLRAAADVDAAKSRMDLAKALLDLATDLQKNGAGLGIDTLRANVQYQNEIQRYTEAGTQLKVALYGLARLLNVDPQNELELADEPSFFQTPTFDADSSLNAAIEARPEMKSVIAQVRAAEFQKKAAKDEKLPRVSVGGRWTLQGVTPTSMIPVYQFGAEVSVPLFTGGRIEAQTATADIEIKKLAQSELEIRNQIVQEVKTALAQLASARTQVDAANLGVSLAKESVQQAQDRFRAGVANNIEVVTAQDDLARANDNQIAALYRYNQSRADLARATGQMETIYTK